MSADCSPVRAEGGATAVHDGAFRETDQEVIA